MVDADCTDGMISFSVMTTDTCDDLQCSNIELDCPSGQVCIQQTGTCMVSECATDADCDDDLFCNGQEFCRLLTRTCEPGTSVPCEEQGIRCNESLGRCENIACVTSADCSPGQICSVSGACTSPG